MKYYLTETKDIAEAIRKNATLKVEEAIYFEDNTNEKTSCCECKSFEIGKYYPNYGIYAGTFSTNHIFVECKNLIEGKKGKFTWDEAVKIAKKRGKILPSVGECSLIIENREAIQAGLEEHGNKLEGWYWSSSEYSYINAWILRPCVGASQGGLDWDYKSNNYSVRPVLALPI